MNSGAHKKYFLQGVGSGVFATLAGIIFLLGAGAAKAENGKTVSVCATAASLRISAARTLHTG